MFQVGDKVFVFSRAAPREEAVYRVTKRFVVLMDGSKWTLDGNPWGAGSHYYRSYIELATDSKRAELERMRRQREQEERVRTLRKAIESRIYDLSLDDLEALHAPAVQPEVRE